MSRFRVCTVLLLVTSSLGGANLALAVPHCFGQPATILGTPHFDRLRGTSSDDVIVGLGGLDHVAGLEGDDRICVGQGNEFAVSGGEGRDRISAGPGRDAVGGGPGDDLVLGDAGSDEVGGSQGNDVLLGGEGPDTLSPGPGQDVARGQSGNDAFLGSRGRNRLRGGGGLDMLDYFGERGVVVDLGSHLAKGKGIDRAFGMEAVRGTDHPDVLKGDSGPNLFIPIWGDDEVIGGSGTDMVDFDRLEDFILTGVTVDLVAGTATGAGSDTLDGIEDVIGSEGPDTIKGDDGPNRLAGSSAGDVLEGRDGDDLLAGYLFQISPQDQFDTQDSGDGGPHIQGDVCLEIETTVNCES
jgi:Ca2+-binding RTX toxin-like protein